MRDRRVPPGWRPALEVSAGRGVTGFSGARWAARGRLFRMTALLALAFMSVAAGVTSAAPVPPAAPSNLTAALLSPTAIRLTWIDHSDNETGYGIWRRSGSADWARVGVAPARGTTFTDQGLTPGTTYTYRVRAHNDFFASDWSNEVTITTPGPPAAPSNLTATVLSATRIRLGWTDNSNNETAFSVWRQSGASDFARVGVVPANTTTFTDTGLDPATLYTYRVRAANDFFASAWSNEVGATTPAGPTVRVSLPAVASRGATTHVTLDFTVTPGYDYTRNPAVRVEDQRGNLLELMPAHVIQGLPDGHGFVDLRTELYPAGTYRVRGEIHTREPDGQLATVYSPAAPLTVPAPYPVRLDRYPIIDAGNSFPASVILSSYAFSSPVVVRLSSSNPAAVAVPATVTVPGGGVQASFTVTAGWLTATTAVTITASTDTGSATASFTVAAVRRVAVFRPSTADWLIREVDGTQTRVSFGLSGDQPVPADYLGAGHAQIALFRPPAAEWLIRRDDGSAVTLVWGSPGDQPVPGDYLGIGHAQMALFRPSTQEWLIRRPDGTTMVVPLGASGDQPVPADYFGLGRLQLAVFRPSTAEWLLRRDDGSVTRIGWGSPGEQPVPADYLGLGHAQLAVYHPFFARWTLRADDGAATVAQLGQYGDVPVPGDYFGLGRDQIAVFNPQVGDWLISTDTTALDAVRIVWGTLNDQPVPARYSSR